MNIDLEAGSPGKHGSTAATATHLKRKVRDFPVAIAGIALSTASESPGPEFRKPALAPGPTAHGWSLPSVIFAVPPSKTSTCWRATASASSCPAISRPDWGPASRANPSRPPLPAKSNGRRLDHVESSDLGQLVNGGPRVTRKAVLASIEKAGHGVPAGRELALTLPNSRRPRSCSGGPPTSSITRHPRSRATRSRRPLELPGDRMQKAWGLPAIRGAPALLGLLLAGSTGRIGLGPPVRRGLQRCSWRPYQR